MKQLFLVKVSYTKQLENGKSKRVVEPYLFDGHTFTDCEANVYEHLGSVIRGGEFTIIKIDKFNVDGIVFNQEEVYDKFFLVKQEFFGVEDNLIKEKVLVNAPSIVDAELFVSQHNERFNDLNPEIKSISETKILDYFQTEVKKNEQEEIESFLTLLNSKELDVEDEEGQSDN
jgi:hypothetical protein